MNFKLKLTLIAANLILGIIEASDFFQTDHIQTGLWALTNITIALLLLFWPDDHH